MIWGELGATHRAYSELMTHWRSVLPPDAMLDVSYEDVVDDIEGQGPADDDRLCGLLPWDDRCIRLPQKQPVSYRTASARFRSASLFTAPRFSAGADNRIRPRHLKGVSWVTLITNDQLVCP